MAYIDFRPSGTGKSLTASLFCFNSLRDKLFLNALFAGAGFADSAGLLNVEAGNSPYVSVGQRSNTFACIHDIREDIEAGTKGCLDRNRQDLVTADYLVNASDGGYIAPSLQFITEDTYVSLARSPRYFTSENGVVLSGALTNPLQERLRIGEFYVSASAESCEPLVALLRIEEKFDPQTVEMQKCVRIIRAYAPFDTLGAHSTRFDGVPLVMIEGVIKLPTCYMLPKQSISPRSVTDRISSLSKDLIAQRAIKTIGEQADKVRYTVTVEFLDDGKGEAAKEIMAWAEDCNLDIREQDLFSVLSKIDELTESQYRSLISLCSRGSARIIEEVQYVAGAEMDLADPSVLIDTYGTSKDRLLAAWSGNVDRKTGGLSVDPYNHEISRSGVVYPDGQGGTRSISGLPLDALLRCPSVFFLDSLGSILYSGQGPALKGGLNSDVVAQLYSSTFCHGILLYAVQDETVDPLTTIDIKAVVTGELSLENVMSLGSLQLPLQISVTSRVVKSRSVRFPILSYSDEDDCVFVKLPPQVTNTPEGLRVAIDKSQFYVGQLVRDGSFGVEGGRIE